MTATTDRITNLCLESDENQEILGSVTHEAQSNEKPFSIQLRTSARVSKKLRLDSQSIPSVVPQEKKEIKPDEKNSDQKSNSRRVHELWSTEDKNAFFEALNEYGKDFDAILTHMNNKRKKRGINQSISKNRDQARHFYYRTWHKISKHLKFPQEVKKAVREQYGLINFGEFRKKVGFVSEKNSVKLNELIYSGNTQVRVKGKTLRIKTPVCRALRKLNQLQETTADVKLPTRIIIELRPRNNDSWCHVQSLAMNPRVRTTLQLHQQLISLISYLQRKWQLPDNKNKEIKISAIGDNIKLDSADVTDTQCMLRLAPRHGINIVAPSVRSGEFITSSRISLLAYEEKFGVGGQAIAENLKLLQTANKSGKSNRNCKKQQTEDEKSKQATENDVQPLAEMDNQSQHCNIHDDGPHSDQDFVSSTVNQLLLLNSELEMTAKYNEDPDWNSPGKDDFELDTDITANENKEEIIEKAKAGWTITNTETIRIGDLYLMFGADSKLQLDYWWENQNDTQKIKTESFSQVVYPEKNKLSESLNKLISLANLYLNKDKRHCSCGHICRSNNKFINGRNRIITKNRNINSGLVNENEKVMNIASSDAAHTKIPLTINNSNPTVFTSRGVSSFTEQLNLQYYNRRRSGDKQRTLPSIPKVTIQVIKPKKEKTPKKGNASIVDKQNETRSCRETPDPTGTNVSTTESKEVTLIQNQLPIFSNSVNANIDAAKTNALCSNLLLQDDDTKSSCSTITKFLKQALPEVLPQPANPSSDGLCTPVIARSTNNSVILDSNENISNTQECPTWCMSEASNFSVSSSLLAQFDALAKPPINAVPVDEETRFSTDVETQFQRLINESSVDYTEKFASLAAEMALETKNAKT